MKHSAMASAALRLVVAMTFAVPAYAEGEKVVIVCEGSSSMWGQIDGTTKIEIARSVFLSRKLIKVE
ncbi:hypothetical protein N5A93_19085 [Roseovarius sp. EGI FJ00037]|uniref:hypothetical protein n=1 Tax=Roseovarius salincola TaxID=2978479 RepID=UPI0022A8650C|nr:hypothetical protein [Roseovarius sp. EGI FJ00037]MCZ0814328.1 hypothetical protein [Roseovarius sp. EGI FJ00037]